MLLLLLCRCVQAVCAVVQHAAAAASDLPYVGTAFKLVEALVGLYSASINATAECKEVQCSTTIYSMLCRVVLYASCF
jgi:hypothetical protein